VRKVFRRRFQWQTGAPQGLRAEFLGPPACGRTNWFASTTLQSGGSDFILPSRRGAEIMLRPIVWIATCRQCEDTCSKPKIKISTWSCGRPWNTLTLKSATCGCRAKTAQIIR